MADVNFPKSGSLAVSNFYQYLLQEEMVRVELIDLYEEVDKAVTDLKDELGDVGEVVIRTQYQQEELKAGLNELLKYIHPTNAHVVKMEIERLIELC